ncbi:MAG TPA: hypothetical protein VG317_17625 [Pseudonocardiaceae bacterium]|nr:hypothetical protein [Pseudonocardiaceae bacterium]
MATAGEDELDRQLDVHDPDPPEWARLPARDVLRLAVDPGSGGMLRWVRRGSTPVLSFTNRFITGLLDLRALDLPYLLEFVRCRFEHPPDARQADLAGLEFSGCWLPGMTARNARSQNDIVLTDTTVDGGSVDLTDARITGSLVLTGSRLRFPNRRALFADRLEISGALLATALDVVGQVRIPGTRTGGNVNLSGANLSNPDGCALDGNGLQVGGNLMLAQDKVTGRRFVARGGIFLPSAHIASDLSLRGASLTPASEGHPDWPLDDPYYGPRTTLIADRIRVDGNLDLDRKFTSRGTVRIVNGRVGGSLRLTEAEIDIADGRSAPYNSWALFLDGTEVAGDFDARSARITGESRLLDVTVSRTLSFDGAYLANPGDDVLAARGCVVGSTFECRDADIYGSVSMQGARIGANLDLRASRLTKPGRYTRDQSVKPCLDIRAITIGRDLTCAGGHDGPFSAAGEIRMQRAEIGRQANFNGAELGAADGSAGDGVALNAFGANVPELRLLLGTPPVGRVILRQTSCASLDDDEKLWHATGLLNVDGFQYGALRRPIRLEDDAAVETRLDWLRTALGGAYRPGPYDQLATMLRTAGNDEHADTVLLNKLRHRYAAMAQGFRVLSMPVLVWSWLQRWMVGYGYRPVRALAWLVILLAAGTLWFWFVPHQCVPQPTVDPRNFAGYRFCPLTNQDDHLVWNPFLFTLDQLIPIVDFGNKNRWALTGVSQWLAAALQAGGWLLATTVATSASRILRRQ